MGDGEPLEAIRFVLPGGHAGRDRKRDWSGNITGDRKAHRHLWIYHRVRFGYKQTTEKAKIIVA